MFKFLKIKSLDLFKNSKIKNYKVVILFFLLFLLFLGYKVFAFFSSPDRELSFNNSSKTIALDDNGYFYSTEASAATIEDFLKEKNISLGEHDQIIPEKNAPLFPGAAIAIRRASKIKIETDGKTAEFYSLEKNAEAALAENNISLKEEDIVQPEKDALVYDTLKITVIRVEIREETAPKEIPFKIQENEDDELGWRVRKVTQKGEKGIMEVKYKVAYHDGKEVSRKILEETVAKEPVAEIVTQGTYVKIGKTHTGAASWYAHTGTMSAANPWLPLGSYVRVTNTENGNSVIVKINDRGPFGNGRIIDLDKVAFAKIASLGQGVINVKMEVIVN